MNKFKKVVLGVLTLTAAIFLSGCATTYSFNNQTYKSADTAIQAHQDFLNSILPQIKPVVETAKIKKVLIVTPTKATCEKLGITKTGSPKREILDYLGTYLKNDFAFHQKFLEKSNMFEVIEHEYAEIPRNAAKNKVGEYDFVVYLDMISPQQISWYITSAEGSDKQINIDNMAPVGSARIQSWLSDINSKL